MCVDVDDHVYTFASPDALVASPVGCMQNRCFGFHLEPMPMLINSQPYPFTLLTFLAHGRGDGFIVGSCLQYGNCRKIHSDRCVKLLQFSRKTILDSWRYFVGIDRVVVDDHIYWYESPAELSEKSGQRHGSNVTGASSILNLVRETSHKYVLALLLLLGCGQRCQTPGAHAVPTGARCVFCLCLCATAQPIWGQETPRMSWIVCASANGFYVLSLRTRGRGNTRLVLKSPFTHLRRILPSWENGATGRGWTRG